MSDTRRIRTSAAFPAGIALLCALVHCSDPAEIVRPADGNDAGTTADASTDVSADVSASDGQASDTTTSDVPLFETGPQDVEVADGCATQTSKVELLPLDVYVMLDQSGSMLGGKWSAVTSALGDFVSANATAELAMALQYFPLPGADVCKWQAYGQPEVPMAPLSDNATALATSLSQHTQPAGETPTLPAVQGAYEYAQTWATANPTHTTVVLLATDGEPNVCGSSVDNVAQAAKVAWEQSSIRTFVIGVGQSLTSLQQIALAGGSDQAFLVDDGGASTEQQFLAALDAIRGKALSCEYPIPTPSSGTIDVNRVNVSFTSGAGDAQWLVHVDGASSCGTASDGWYYDDPTSPTLVILCPAACDAIKSDAKGRVDVIFGCKTKLA